MEITQTELQNGKRIKNLEDTIRDLWNNIKMKNIHIIGAPETEERKKGPEKLPEETSLSGGGRLRNRLRNPTEFQIR